MNSVRPIPGARDTVAANVGAAFVRSRDPGHFPVLLPNIHLKSYLLASLG